MPEQTTHMIKQRNLNLGLKGNIPLFTFHIGAVILVHGLCGSIFFRRIFGQPYANLPLIRRTSLQEDWKT